MSTVGIITEFNPFHNGHEYAIEKAKEITGADTAIIVMSGDFVQRGCPAVCNKFIRTKMALASNADIVIELPTCFATSSAQGFAEGGVALLTHTGVVDYICFGSESGDIEEIMNIADTIASLDNNTDFQNKIHELIQNGFSYPSARAKVLSSITNIDDAMLASPNNILAIEYCLAIKKLASKGIKVPQVMTFKRIGDGFNTFEMVDEKYVSATSIRALINDTFHPNDLVNSIASKGRPSNLKALQLKNSLLDYVPEQSIKYLSEALGLSMPILSDDFSNLLFLKLNTTPLDTLKTIPDINRDLLNTIVKNTREPFIISELIERIKTKAFTYSAISRALFSILLFTETVVDEPEYIRLLGFKKDKSVILKDMRDKAALPIINKLADANIDSAMLRQDIFAANLYEQVVLYKFGHGYTDEYRHGVIIQ